MRRPEPPRQPQGPEHVRGCDAVRHSQPGPVRRGVGLEHQAAGLEDIAASKARKLTEPSVLGRAAPRPSAGAGASDGRAHRPRTGHPVRLRPAAVDRNDNPAKLTESGPIRPSGAAHSPPQPRLARALPAPRRRQFGRFPGLDALVEEDRALNVGFRPSPLSATFPARLYQPRRPT